MIYLDTRLVVYLVEDRAARGAVPEGRMRESMTEAFATSPLVRMEALVKPLRDGDMTLQRRYENMTAAFAPLPIGSATHDQAALLRARFGLRTPDAPHPACAQLHACTALWTDDRRLQRAAHGLAVSLDDDR